MTRRGYLRLNRCMLGVQLVTIVVLLAAVVFGDGWRWIRYFNCVMLGFNAWLVWRTVLNIERIKEMPESGWPYF